MNTTYGQEKRPVEDIEDDRDVDSNEGETRVKRALAVSKRAGSKLGRIVREKPLAAVGLATFAGVLIGGILLRKPGRLLFIAAAGFVATELWKREGKVDVRGLIDRITGADTD
jgi:hypothetical protein